VSIYFLLLGVPKNKANPMQTIPKATIIDRSIGAVLNHTRVFLSMNKNITPITFIDRLVKKNELGQDFKLTDDHPRFYALPLPSMIMGGCRGILSSTRASRSPARPQSTALLPLPGIHPGSTQ
jgi:hypothetical protein